MTVFEIVAEIKLLPNKFQQGVKDAVKKGQELRAKTESIAKGAEKATDALGKVGGVSTATARKIEQFTQKLVRQNSGIDTQREKVAKLEAEYKKLASGEVKPKSLAALEDSLYRTDLNVNSLGKKIRALTDKKIKVGLSGDEAADLDFMTGRFDVLVGRSDAFRAKLEQLRLDPSMSDEAQRLAEQIENAKNKLQDMTDGAEETAEKLEDLSGGLSDIEVNPSAVSDVTALGNRVSELTEKLGNVRSPIGLIKLLGDIRKAQNDFQKLRGSVNTAMDTKPVSRFKSVLSGIAGFFKRIGSAAVSAFKKAGSVAAIAAKKIGGAVAGGLKKAGSAIGGLSGKFKNVRKHSDAAGNAVTRFAGRFKSLLSAVLVFEVLRRGIVALKDYLGGLLNTNAQFVTSLNAVKDNLSAAFQPIYEAALPAINALMSALAKGTTYLAAFTSMLFGKTISQSRAASKAINTQADAYSKAGGAAKSAAKNVQSFDELNRLSAADSGAGGGDAGSLIEEFDDADINYGWLDEFKRKLLDLVPDLEYFFNLGESIGKKITDGLAKIPWDRIRAFSGSFAQKIAAFLNGAVAGADWSVIGSTIAQALNTALDFVYNFLTTFSWADLGKAIGTGINSLFANFEWGTLGATLAAWVMAFFDTLYGLFTTLKWKDIGRYVSNAVNSFFDKVQPEKLAATVSEGIKGALSMIGEAIRATDWAKIGEDIREFLTNIDWKGIWEDVKAVIRDAFGGFRDFLVGLFGSEESAKKAETLAVTVGVVVAAVAGLAKAAGALKAIKGVAELFGAGKAISKGAEATGVVDAAASGLSANLVSLAKNLGIGLIIIAEVAAAAILITGAIWVLGKELEQVGLAWQPVIDNGETIAAAMGIGTGLLIAIGAAAAALGTAAVSSAGSLPIAIGIGTAMLVELGIATGIFIAEIWAIGKGLDEISRAWEPVIQSGDTIANAIAVGTGLLIGVGTAAAALGVAAVASVGLLPLAIGLGIAMLVELTDAFIVFTESLVTVAGELSNNLHPALRDLNKKLPELSSDMSSFVGFMKEFAGHVVAYSASSAIAGIAATIDTIIGWFTKDPIKKLADDVKKVYEHMTELNEKLRLAVPEMRTATNMLSEYSKLLGSIEEITGERSALTLSNDIFANMKDFGNNIVTGLHEGVKAKSSLFKDVGNQFTGWWEDVKSWWKLNPVSNVTKEAGKNLVQGLISGVKSLINDVTPPFKNALDGIKEYWGSFPSWFGTGVSKPLQDALDTMTKNLKNNITGSTSGVVDAYTKLFNAVLSKAESFANKFQDSIYKMAKSAANMLSNLPNTSKVYVSQPSKINIPRLANGGLIAPNNPALYVLGDNLREEEIVSPRSAMREEVVKALSEYGYSTGNAEIISLLREIAAGIHAGHVIEINGQVLARESSKGINNLSQQYGLNAILT